MMEHEIRGFTVYRDRYVTKGQKVRYMYYTKGKENLVIYPRRGLKGFRCVQLQFDRLQ